MFMYAFKPLDLAPQVVADRFSPSQATVLRSQVSPFLPHALQSRSETLSQCHRLLLRPRSRPVWLHRAASSSRKLGVRQSSQGVLAKVNHAYSFGMINWLFAIPGIKLMDSFGRRFVAQSRMSAHATDVSSSQKPAPLNLPHDERLLAHDWLRLLHS